MKTLLKYEKYLYIILLVGAVIYFPIFFNGFVWDDLAFIINNPQIHQLNLPALLGQNLFNSGPFYRPIPAIYFALVYSLFGQHAFFYHFLQLTLHLVDTYLLFLFFCLFFTDGISFLLALLFLVHPINAESVAYIGSTQSEIYFLPGISALLLASREQLTRTRLLLVIGLLFFSIMTKETGFLFLLLVLLYRYLFKLGKLKEFLFSGVAIVVFYLLIRVFIGGVKFASASYVSIATLSLPQRLVNIPAIFIYYIKTFIFPLNLAIWQQWIVTAVTFRSFFIPLTLYFIFLLFLIGVALSSYIYDKKIQSSIEKIIHTKQYKKNKIQLLHEPKRFPQYIFFFSGFSLVLGLLGRFYPWT